MSYEFNGMLYDSEEHYYHAIAESWLTADGLNSKQEIINYMDNLTPEAIAHECYDAWYCDNLPEEMNAVDRALLLECFRELSANRDWFNNVT